jgi:uncharacterized protein (TIGR03086 family)
MIDLGPAARRMAQLIADVDDDQLGAPTPCPGSTVGDLIDHVSTLSLAFGAKAAKEPARSGPPPAPDGANLGSGWRDRISGELDALARAWSDPQAWEGMTTAGGIDMPSGVAGVVALDELVVHGWDIAMATGQPYSPADDEITACVEFVATFDAPRDGRLFGPVVAVPDDAPALERLLGLTGRDPHWVASTQGDN